MAARSRGGQVISALLRGPPAKCHQCARSSPSLLSRRLYSDASVAAVQPPSSQTASNDASATGVPPPQPETASKFRIHSGIILTRPPLLMRELTPFEEAFFLYQKRLEERLSAPYRKGFHFKTDTATELDWRIKARERRGVAARDIGRYNPRGRLAWNDEVLVGSKTSETQTIVDRTLEAAEMRVSEDGEQIAEEDRVPVEKPFQRRTEADVKNDVRRLDRALDQTLYLIVKKGTGKDASWGFPEGQVPTHEALHETASRVLVESAGVNMNTWIIGRVPVAYYIKNPVFEKDGTTVKEPSTKTFFLKGRIMAGQADLTGNKHDLTDFMWLTKSELEKKLSHGFYWKVRGMMADR